MTNSRWRIPLGKQIAVLVAVVAMIGGLIASSPAGAGEKVAIPLTFVVKADSLDAARAGADKAKATGGVTVFWAERSLYAVSVTIEVDADKLDDDDEFYKKTQDAAKKLSEPSGVHWAVAKSDSVDPDRFFAWRFFAWRFFAWTSGNASQRRGFDLVSFLELESSHEIATGRGVTVAVLDTGFDTDHPLLESRLLPGIDLAEGHPNVGDWLNGVDDDGDGHIDESHGHGTFVAGVIAQIAPDASILPIRVLEADGVGEMYSVIDGIDEAVARGADVINISFGTSRKDKELEAAVKRAQKAGVVVVASAGNAGSKEKQYPAAFNGVVSVAAYDPASGGVASWGSYGDWIDVSAPGIDIVSAVPGGTMRAWSGSSLSAPTVSAQVALLMELDRDKAGKDAEKMVRASANKSRHDRRTKEGAIDLLTALNSVR